MTSIPSLRNPSLADLDTVDNEGSVAKRGNALSNKLNSVLSSSYADTETRDALRLLDTRYNAQDLQGDFDLKYESQKEVIEANGKIIDDFSQVAKVLQSQSASSQAGH